MAYLDWAATSPPDQERLHKAFEESLRFYGNPSSAHQEGKAAKAALEGARASLLESLFQGRKPQGRVYFTGSGTEADQIPLLEILGSYSRGIARMGSSATRPHILVSSIEHPAVYNLALHLSSLGIEVQFLDPDVRGMIDPGSVAEKIKPSTRMVAVMAVNNETGAVQDIPGIAKAIGPRLRRPGLPRAGESGRDISFHVDCVQALGKTNLDFLGAGLPAAGLPAAGLPAAGLLAAGPSSAAFSAHKIRGPKGIGALWLSSAIDVLAKGGGQEEGIRSGTENLFGVLAFASCAARAVSMAEESKIHARALEKILLEGLRAIPSVMTIPADRSPGEKGFSPYIIGASFPGASGEVLVRALADRGIALSTGSACSSKKKSERRVLKAMGLKEDLAFSSLRISTGENTIPREIEEFLNQAEDLFRRLKT
jgi:cysteine desulfurase